MDKEKYFFLLSYVYFDENGHKTLYMYALEILNTGSCGNKSLSSNTWWCFYWNLVLYIKTYIFYNVSFIGFKNHEHQEVPTTGFNMFNPLMPIDAPNHFCSKFT